MEWVGLWLGMKGGGENSCIDRRVLIINPIIIFINTTKKKTAYGSNTDIRIEYKNENRIQT